MTAIRIPLVTALALVLFAMASLPAQAAKPTRLVATVGPGFTITLTKAGKKVRALAAGRYTITVRDRSSIHNFRLYGNGLNKNSGVVPTGTRTWTVTFRKGKTYRFVCDPHASSMKGSFRVT